MGPAVLPPRGIVHIWPVVADGRQPCTDERVGNGPERLAVRWRFAPHRWEVAKLPTFSGYATAIIVELWHRLSVGRHAFDGCTPAYRARGLMRRSSWYCLMAWAIQPTVRPSAKMASPAPSGRYPSDQIGGRECQSLPGQLPTPAVTFRCSKADTLKRQTRRRIGKSYLSLIA